MFMRLPDTAAPTRGPAFDGAVDAIGDLTVRHGCGCILAPWQHDPHCDHEASWMMGVAASRRSNVQLMAYPVWGWTLPASHDIPGPLPQGSRLDISNYLAVKRAAIAAHQSQHGLVVPDARDEFVLPKELLAVFDAPYEVLLGTPT
jgi:LmbE family N-acetylglucosaminyl deacetylase